MAVRSLIQLFIAVILIGHLQPALAACGPAQDRSRVGLALSGGGARGAAHVGVIRELEALRIPVDCIAGTSMGAIVGGLYASGMSADEIEVLMNRIDWEETLRDRPPRQDLTFRRKQDDRSFLVKFNLGLKNGNFAVPKGLVQGQKQNMILKSATLPVSGIHDFDRLPIPFRALATDIETGASIAIEQGNLAAAIQASMSAPGVFSPREIGGRLLVDGGISNNLPINVVREMGADIVIAVDIAFPLVSREELDSGLEIANQMLTILMRQQSLSEKKTLTAGDVLIEPDLGSMDSSDFSRLRETIRIGAQSVQARSGSLARLSLAETQYQQHLASRAAIRPGNPVIDYVTVVNGSRLSPRVIERRLSAGAGQALDQATLEKDIARIYGLDTFEQVDYEIVSEGDRTGLEVRTTAKSWGPSFVDFGLSLEEDFEGSSDYTFAARFTRAELNRLGGEWRVDTQVGQRTRFFTEFYQPLDLDTRFFLAPQIELSRTNIGVFENGRRTSEFRISSAGAGLDFGRNLGNWGEFRIGFRRSAGRAVPRVGAANLPDFDFNSGGWFTTFAVDWLDDSDFPGDGQLASISWQAERTSLGADLSSDILRLNWLGAHSWGKHTLLANMRFASAVDDVLALQNTFNLGGLFNLSGYSTDELAGRQLGLARLVYYKQIAMGRLAALSLPVYAGGSLEAGNVWQNREEVSLGDLRYGSNLFLGIDTPLGPVYLAVGFSEGGETAGYFYLGQTF